MITLDASALLAFLFREPGHERVAQHIERCCVSTVSLAETLSRLAQDGHDPTRVLARFRETAIELVPFDPLHAAIAAGFMRSGQPLGLSIGDRACLALAAARGIPALTADRAWLRADFGVEVIVVP